MLRRPLRSRRRSVSSMSGWIRAHRCAGEAARTPAPPAGSGRERRAVLSLLALTSCFRGHALSPGGALRRASTCWPADAPFTPLQCCVERDRDARCFPEPFGPEAFESCCSPEVLLARPGGQQRDEEPPGLPRRPSGQGNPLSNLSVDLLVRSFALEAEMLRWFFVSVELYWPRWGEVVLVLDAESETDQALCETTGAGPRGAGAPVPAWVRCAFEPPPRFYDSFLPVPNDRSDGAGVTMSKGKSRAMWSLFWADRYCAADYIAEVDADVVIATPGLRELFFVPGSWGSRPRPVFYGSAVVAEERGAINRLLGFKRSTRFHGTVQWSGSFPVIAHRRHFAALRRYIIRAMNMSTNDFDPAFVTLMRRSWNFAIFIIQTVEFLPWFQFVLSEYLYRRQRDAYHWSIDEGFVRELPRYHTCPSLNPVRHMHECGGKTGGPARGRDAEYALQALKFINVGVCAVPSYRRAEEAPAGARRWPYCPRRGWCQEHGIPNISQFFYTNSHFGDPALCMAHGGRRAQLVRWRSRPCGRRRFEGMLGDYRQLIARSYGCW